MSANAHARRLKLGFRAGSVLALAAAACVPIFQISDAHAAAEQPSISIKGVVFNDVNGDGLRNPGEPGLAGWTVGLLLTDMGFPEVTSTTGADGAFALVVPLTELVAQANRVFVHATPQSEPPGMIWVTTFVTSAFRSIPDAALLEPLAPGATFVVDFGEQLRPGVRSTPGPRPGTPVAPLQPPSVGTGLGNQPDKGGAPGWAMFMILGLLATALLLMPLSRVRRPRT